MDAALCLLNALNTRAQEQEAAGESSKSTVAAISMTAQAMQDTMADTVGIIAYTYDLDDDKNVNKRWTVNGQVNRDPFGRHSYGVGISHSWGRKRRSVSKRGDWNVGAHVNRGPGGTSYGASVSYSWGRR
ncbi:hypothetical protein EGW08_006005 [Elysia chlorotica]|uniref:Uncharacterized protein n=1 Tax=Elysia chlorotica TaxID=188477 RepID=A0A3S0ZYI6_ELYCH|nr:hypothetical protein EGW08_006005 [Elysia chlorotica]